MTRVLVINHNHSVVCGIHDLGLRVVAELRRSRHLEVHYAECGSLAEYHETRANCDPEVVVVNYRADLLPWWGAGSRAGHSVLLTIAHNYEPATIGHATEQLLAAGFDHVLALDPHLQVDHPRVHVVGRPIPDAVQRQVPATDAPPRIGSFGFAFPHKGFDSVARETCEAVDEATFALHMPEAHFNGAGGSELYVPMLLDTCHRAITKPGITIRHTSEHLDGQALVTRLTLSDVNCLLYHPGQPDAGQSSAMDYAIATRRPLLVSEATMFRTGGDRVAVWPGTRLADVLVDYEAWQQRAETLYDELHGRLVVDFERVVERVT